MLIRNYFLLVILSFLLLSQAYSNDSLNTLQNKEEGFSIIIENSYLLLLNHMGDISEFEKKYLSHYERPVMGGCHAVAPLYIYYIFIITIIYITH